MTTLKNRKPKDSYKELLKINSVPGSGVDSSLRSVEDGDGTMTPMKIASDKIAFHDKQWPTSGGPAGAFLKVNAADTTKLEWAVQEIIVPVLTTTSFFPGVIEAMTGTIRWYPGKVVTLKSVFISVSSAPSNAITIDVLKSGVSIFPGTKPTIASGNFASTLMALNVSMTGSDYLTIDILGGNGSDLSVRLEYQ